jgi:hypothetical protein
MPTSYSLEPSSFHAIPLGNESCELMDVEKDAEVISKGVETED